MSEISDVHLNQPPPLAVAAANGNRGGQGRERRRRFDSRAGARREAITELLREQGVAEDDGLIPILELITNTETQETRIRVWDERTGNVVVELSAAEFAAAASALQAFAGLLVERKS